VFGMSPSSAVTVGRAREQTGTVSQSVTRTHLECTRPASNSGVIDSGLYYRPGGSRHGCAWRAAVVAAFARERDLPVHRGQVGRSRAEAQLPGRR
jgi:hypothetical protein